MSSAVRAAVPDGASSLRSWCSSTISAFAMCCDASAANFIMSTAEIAKFGAKKTFAAVGGRAGGNRSLAAARGRSPLVPMTTCTPGRDALQRVAQSGVRPREVDDDVGVAEHLRERRAQRRVGLARQHHVLGALDRGDHRLAHAPRRARDGDPDHAVSSSSSSGASGSIAARKTSSSAPTAAALRRSGASSSRMSPLTSSSVTASMRSTTSSTDSSGSPLSTAAPSRLMREAVDSSDSTMRPLTFSLERSSSSGVTPSSRSRASSSATTFSAGATLSGRVPR